VAKIKGFTVFP